MYIHTPTRYRCSVCGSVLTEIFKNDTESGVRCITCGHEKLFPKPHTSYASTKSKSYVYVKSNDPIEF